MAEKTPAIEIDSDLAAEARSFADKVLSGEIDTPDPNAEPAKADNAEKPAAEQEKPAEPLAKSEEPAKVEEDADSLAIVLRAKRNARKIEERASRDAQERIQAIERRAAELESAQRQLVDGIKSDPIAALRGLGFSEEQIARKLLGQDAGVGKPDPLASRLEKLEQLITEQRQADAARAKAAEEAQRSQVIDTVKRGFIGFVVTNEPEFPHLTAHYEDSPQELADKAMTIAETYRERTGRETSYKEVAAYLETELAKRYSVVQQRTTKPATEQPAVRQGQRTLTPGDASQRSTTPRKAVSDMDEDERRAEAARLAAELLPRRR